MKYNNFRYWILLFSECSKIFTDGIVVYFSCVSIRNSSIRRRILSVLSYKCRGHSDTHWSAVRPADVFPLSRYWRLSVQLSLWFMCGIKYQTRGQINCWEFFNSNFVEWESVFAYSIVHSYFENSVLVYLACQYFVEEITNIL